MRWILLLLIPTCFASAQGSLVQEEIYHSREWKISKYAEADRLIITGRTHYAKQRYHAALKSYKLAVGKLLTLPDHADRLRSYCSHLGDGATAVSVTLLRTGDKKKAMGVLLSALNFDPANEYLLTQFKKQLGDTPLPRAFYKNRAEGYRLHKEYKKACQQLSLYYYPFGTIAQ